MAKMTIELPDELLTALDREVERHSYTKSAAIRHAIETLVDKLVKRDPVLADDKAGKK